MQDKDVIEIPVGKYLSRVRGNPWIIATFVLAIALVVVLIVNGGLGATGNVVSAETAGESAISFINSNPNLQGEVELLSVEKTGSFYVALMSYQGQQVPVYVTLDGEYLLSGAPIPLNGDGIEGIGSDTNVDNEIVDIDTDDDAVLGDPNAPVTIIEFSDYQCPFCERFWSETLPLIKEEYIDTGKVRFIYRDYPLSAIHPMAQKAAEAAECVRSKGGDEAYYEFHDILFENQEDLSEENLKKWARGMGYNINSCLDNGDFEEEVLADLEDGSDAGISGTPGFFINGVKLEGALPFSSFKQIIDAELAKASA